MTKFAPRYSFRFMRREATYDLRLVLRPNRSPAKGAYLVVDRSPKLKKRAPQGFAFEFRRCVCEEHGDF